jgi:predicted HicB family RNase H-like nuclease
MGRKRSKPDTGTEPEEKRPVAVKLSPELHRQLRQLAAAAEMSMSQYATALVIDGIASEAGRKKIAVDR